MLDKFQKLFGPGSSKGIGSDQLGTPEPERRHHSWIRLRRRILGLAVMLTALMVILPGIFEKNESLTRQSAKTEIPPVSAQAETARISLSNDSRAGSGHDNPEVALSQSSVPNRESAAASSLGLDNRVAINEKPMPREDQGRTLPKKAETAGSRTRTAGETKTGTAQEGKTARTGRETKEKAAGTKAGREARSDRDTKKKTAVTTPKKAAAQEAPATAAKPSPQEKYYIQVVATAKKETADRYSARVRNAGLPVYVETVRGQDGSIYRVRAGIFHSMKEAKSALDALALNSISNGGIRPTGSSKN